MPQITEASEDTRVVILTMQSEPVFAREAMQAGVCGYILKEAADSELVKAVRLAADGKTYLQPELGARLAAEPAATPPADPPAARSVAIRSSASLSSSSSFAARVSS